MRRRLYKLQKDLEDRLKELLAKPQEPQVVVVRYTIPGYLEDYPGPPEEVVQAAVEEAKREGRPVAVVYWHPPEELVRQVEEELRRLREEEGYPLPEEEDIT